MNRIITFCLLSYQFISIAQESTSHNCAKKHVFTLSGYGDIYYGYQLGSKAKKEDFYYNHKLNNQIRTNLLLIKGEYLSPRFHATLGLMTGDYSRFNLAAEPNWAKPLNEAFLGFKLSKKRSIWWDLGVYSSFIGIESSISADCYTLTRSIVAENSPYYLSGTRVLFKSDNEKHEAGFHILNGWQRIGWDPAIKKPSFGGHYKYNFNDAASVMYGVFYGSIYPDSLKTNRLYQHVNGTVSFKKWKFIGTLDVGLESGYYWVAAQIMAQYTINKNWDIAQRIEAYHDPNNRCARIGASESTSIGAYTICTSYHLNNNVLFRLEPKVLAASESILKGEQFMLHVNAGISVRF